MTMTEIELEDLITAEVEILINKCVSAGAVREEAEKTLRYQCFKASLDFRIAQEKARAAEKARCDSPLTALLRKAFDCEKAKDSVGNKKFSKEWLLLKHSAEVGDTLLVYGWTKAREIKLDDFCVSWSCHDDFSEDGFLWFSGSTRIKLPRRTDDSHGASMSSAVYVVRKKTA